MSSVLKATSLLKNRQGIKVVRDLVTISTSRKSASVYAVERPPHYETEALGPAYHTQQYNSSRTPSVSTSVTKVYDHFSLPPSPTTESTSDSGGPVINSELAGIELPFIPYTTRPVVNTWIDPSFGVCIHPWQQLYFDYGVTGIPKTNLRPSIPDEDRFHLSKGFGEDACFIRRDSLGVADGVGGWKKIKGASSAFFSRNLMHFACEELSKIDQLCNSVQATMENGNRFVPHNEGSIAYNQVDPVKILDTSYRLASESASLYKIKGSSTACIVILRNKELRIANLGDCGVVVLRSGSIVFQTHEQQHSFNFPYQLGTNSKDRPTDAQSYSFQVQCGDVIVMGSDGLFDNLFGSDIEDEVSKWSPTWDWESLYSYPGDILGLSTVSTTVRTRHTICDVHLRPGDLSHALAARACHVSQQTSSEQATPFKERATKEGLSFKGGKRDDITVLVAVVAPTFTKTHL